jgi:predicted MFS family arabinose efflux permease
MTDDALSAAPPPINLRAALISIVALRTVINIAFRSPFPFLGTIALAFQADPKSVGWLGAAFSVAGLFAPLTALVEAYLGRRGVIYTAIGLFAATCFALPFAPTLGIAAGLFVLLGVATALFEPQSLAFISEHVPFERRGAAIGFVELAWALSWIIGAPLFGFFVDYGRWWMTFVACGVAALVAATLVLRSSGMGAQTARSAAVGSPLALGGIAAVFRSGAALRMLAFGALLAMPVQITNLVYGPWLQSTFTLTSTWLGIVSIVIGVADLLAELATIAVVDRLGKRASLLISTALYAASFGVFLLGAHNQSLGITLFGLFLIFFNFEFALVTSLATQSEIMPSARTTMNGFAAGSRSLGRIIAALVALPLFVSGGLDLAIFAGTALTLLALAVGWTLGRVRARASA